MEKKKNGSLKTKILIIILPIVALMITVLTTVSYKISSSEIKSMSKETLESSIKSQNKEIVAWMDEKLSAAEALKSVLENGDLTNVQINNILDGYYSKDSDFVNGIYIGDEKGNLYKATQSSKTETNVTDSQWYKEGLTRINLEYGDAYVNSNGQSVISATGIIDDGKEEIKVLAADVTLDRIRIIVNSNVEMEDAQTFLVDANGYTILSHRKGELVGTSIKDATSDPMMADVLKCIEDGKLTTTIMDDYEIAFKKVDNTSWILVSYIPMSTVLSQVNMLRNYMIIIGIICTIILLVIIERVIHISIKPVKELTEVITAMSSGDFTIEVKEKGNNEITVMFQSVREFMDSMKRIISQIGSVSKRLEGQAISSSKAAEEMQDASKHQQDSMQGLNDTVDALVGSVNEIAENATTLAGVVADTRKNSMEVTVKMEDTVVVTEKGRHDMEDVKNAMNVISESISTLEDAVNKVGTASDEITKIVGMISEIAEETNLLSLNASIEAARAGEAGRGFAVVAGEIGTLAGNSAKSAQDIAELIEKIRILVSDCVKQSDSSAEQIYNSRQLIDTALDTFQKIYGNINETNALINDVMDKITQVDDVATNVAAVSQEQAASATMILETSENMVTQAESILMNSSKVAKDSKELATSATELDTNIKVFKVGGDSDEK